MTTTVLRLEVSRSSTSSLIWRCYRGPCTHSKLTKRLFYFCFTIILWTC